MRPRKGTLTYSLSAGPRRPRSKTHFAASGLWVGLFSSAWLKPSIPIYELVGKEVALVGTLCFHSEFAAAARMIDSGAIYVSLIITHSFAPEDLAGALRVAANRALSVKTQLTFT